MCQPDEVYDVLQQSSVFSWGVYREEENGHIGFLLKFDDQPRFTLDFNPVVANVELLVGCKATVTINRPTGNGEYEYYGDLQRIGTSSEQWKWLAWREIKGILKKPAKKYSLLAIWEQLQQSSVFSWGVYQKTELPFRHTGFLLKFDDQPRFTLDFNPVVTKGSNATVTINYPSGEYEYFGDLQRIVTQFPDCKTFAWFNIIVGILKKPGKKYSLLVKNCRSHVVQGMTRVCSNNSCNCYVEMGTKRAIEATRETDGLLLGLGFGTAATAATIIGILVLGTLLAKR